MISKIKIKETIIVEGKTDVAKLSSFIDGNFIITNGNVINNNTLNEIKKAEAANGIILCLDPDFTGKQIRTRIQSFLNKPVKHIFFKISDINENVVKKGIAEIELDKLYNKFKSFVLNNDEINLNRSGISWNDYVDFNLNTKNKRLYLCDMLEIPYYNHKQLFKHINFLNINKEEIIKILEKYEHQ
ncbi:ribonuclease M5 [Ureaplasma canigenitalium]|uniref:ribonuclease M5 n=1 Tax=Ureaplasma canigenitalium TaxID=42092 RepID=UPI000A7B50CC|nr:ribonuclease M5 [Ureaplasma canigenitalium]